MTHTVDVLRLDVEGNGVALVNGAEVRVPFVIPGERVEIRLAGPRGSAELLRILSPSPQRVTPRCRHFGPCGGCAWQHIAYPEQLRIKQQILQRLLDQSLRRNAPAVLPTLPTPAGRDVTGGDRSGPWTYRNKAHFVLGPGARGRSLEIGHYRRGSRRLVPVVECPVHAEDGNRVAFALRDALQRASVPGTTPDAAGGVARHVVIRAVEDGDAWLATLVVTENVKPLRRVTTDFVRGQGETRATWGLYLNLNDRPGPYLFGRETRHLAGAREVREQVAGISYVISPTSFFQTNVRAARVLVAEVLQALADPAFERVLDLYAGVGLFALPLAATGQGRQVTAVEENREAVAAATASSRHNRLPEASLRTLALEVEDALPRLRAKWDGVVLDPPREGCPAIVLDWLFRTVRPRRIVYVSCNPEALARDLRGAPAAGYTISRVQPVDMFPHTAHIETVVVLDRD